MKAGRGPLSNGSPWGDPLPCVACVVCGSTDIAVRTRHFNPFFYCRRCRGIRKVKHLPKPSEARREGR